MMFEATTQYHNANKKKYRVTRHVSTETFFLMHQSQKTFGFHPDSLQSSELKLLRLQWQNRKKSIIET